MPSACQRRFTAGRQKRFAERKLLEYPKSARCEENIRGQMRDKDHPRARIPVHPDKRQHAVSARKMLRANDYSRRMGRNSASGSFFTPAAGGPQSCPELLAKSKGKTRPAASRGRTAGRVPEAGSAISPVGRRRLKRRQMDGLRFCRTVNACQRNVATSPFHGGAGVRENRRPASHSRY